MYIGVGEVGICVGWRRLCVGGGGVEEVGAGGRVMRGGHGLKIM